MRSGPSQPDCQSGMPVQFAGFCRVRWFRWSRVATHKRSLERIWGLVRPRFVPPRFAPLSLRVRRIFDGRIRVATNSVISCRGVCTRGTKSPFLTCQFPPKPATQNPPKLDMTIDIFCQQPDKSNSPKSRRAQYPNLRRLHGLSRALNVYHSYAFLNSLEGRRRPN